MTGTHQHRDRLSVTWSDGRTDAFHYVWLRDNCRCPECCDADALERRFDTVTMPADIAPREVAVGDGISIEWSDGHRTTFSETWLRDHVYGRRHRDVATVAPMRWDASIADRPPQIAFDDIDADPAGLLRWLRLIRDYGFAVVRGTISASCTPEPRSIHPRVGGTSRAVTSTRTTSSDGSVRSSGGSRVPSGVTGIR